MGLVFWYGYWIFEPSLNKTIIKFASKVNFGNFIKQEGELVKNKKAQLISNQNNKNTQRRKQNYHYKAKYHRGSRFLQVCQQTK